MYSIPEKSGGGGPPRPLLLNTLRPRVERLFSAGGQRGLIHTQRRNILSDVHFEKMLLLR